MIRLSVPSLSADGFEDNDFVRTFELLPALGFGHAIRMMEAASELGCRRIVASGEKRGDPKAMERAGSGGGTC